MTTKKQPHHFANLADKSEADAIDIVRDTDDVSDLQVYLAREERMGVKVAIGERIRALQTKAAQDIQRTKDAQAHVRHVSA